MCNFKIYSFIAGLVVNSQFLNLLSHHITDLIHLFFSQIHGGTIFLTYCEVTNTS